MKLLVNLFSSCKEYLRPNKNKTIFSIGIDDWLLTTPKVGEKLLKR